MKVFLICVILVFTLTILCGCGKEVYLTEKTINSNDPVNSISFSNSASIAANKYVVFYFDQTKHNWIFKEGKSTGLTNNEIMEINDLLTKTINDFNSKEKIKLNLSEYKFQYLPIINSADEKEIWINAFCGDPKNWEEELVVVDDGGKCYWQTTINLTKKNVESLMINGES